MIIIYIYKIVHPVSLTTEQFEAYYELMKKVDGILLENDIPYFIIDGTLLGSMRHGKMIPWDDDIDIGMEKEHIEKMKNIDWESYGLKASNLNWNTMGKIRFIDKFTHTDKFKGVFIDVFPYEKNDDKYTLSDPWSLKMWPQDYFYHGEIYPIKRYKFGNLMVNGPNKPKLYLERLYGNWKKPSVGLKKIILQPIESIEIYVDFYKTD